MLKKLKSNLSIFLISRFDEKRAEYYIDFFLFAFGFCLSAFISLLITVLVNENLEKSNLGKLVYSKSLLEFVTMFATLSLHRSYLRFNVIKVDSFLKRIVGYSTVLALFIVAAASFYLDRSVLALVFVSYVIYEERLYFLRSIMDTFSVNVLRIGASVITLLIILTFVYLFELNSERVLFSYGIGFLFSILFYFYQSKKFEVSNDSASLKEILLFTLPGLGSILVKWLLDLNSQLMLKYYFDYVEVAKYGIAMRSLLLVKLFSSLLMMFFPTVYFRELEIRDSELIKKIRLGVISVMSTICGMTLFFAPYVYDLMGASEYLDSILMFRILVVSEFIFVLGGLWSLFFTYIKKTYISLVIFTIGALMNFGILYVGLTSFGIYTAAYSVLISNIFIAAVFIILALRSEKKYINQAALEA